MRHLAIPAVGILIVLLLATCAGGPTPTATMTATAITPTATMTAMPTAPAAATAAAPAPAVSDPAPLGPPEFPPDSVRIAGEIGTPVTGSVDSTVKDVFVEYAVEPGASYEIFVADGYNNGANKNLSVAGAAKAVGYWIVKSDAKTSYPKSVYREQESDSKSGYGFIGLTPDGRPGSVALVQAEGTTLFVHVQRYKASYTGNFAVAVYKK